MKLNTSIDSVTADVDQHRLVVKSARPLTVLSSAVHNGGFTKANNIISIHVPEINDENNQKANDDLDKELHENPENILIRAMKRQNLDVDTTIGIMTHADVRNVEIAHKNQQNITLTALVTGGVEVAATASELTISKPTTNEIDPIGTINVILIVNGNLTESCMIDAMKTVIEAKTVALRELDVRSYFSGDPASGTVTDSAVIASTQQGTPIKYAGTATVIGELIGDAVKGALKKTLLKEQQVSADRCLTKRLKEHKICIEKAATNYVKTHPKLATQTEQFNKQVQQTLSNPKIVPFVIAGLRLDEDLKNGLIPGRLLDKSTFVEALQNAIVGCLCNKNQADIKTDKTRLASENFSFFFGVVLETVMNCVYLNMCS
jgi:adenosylcobinamide amidohydrolase